MSKAPVPKLKKWGQGITGHEKWSKATGVKFEFAVPGFSPNKNSKPKWG
jgi:hypothetical protein